jgi:hypothetical protein
MAPLRIDDNLYNRPLQMIALAFIKAAILHTFLEESQFA